MYDANCNCPMCNTLGFFKKYTLRLIVMLIIGGIGGSSITTGYYFATKEAEQPVRYERIAEAHLKSYWYRYTGESGRIYYEHTSSKNICVAPGDYLAIYKDDSFKTVYSNR